MKRLLIFFGAVWMTFSSLVVIGQEANLVLIQKYHFDLYDNTEITWQKVFTSDYNATEIHDALIGLNLFDRILVDKGSQIIGTLLPIKSRYKELGRGWMSTDFIASEVEIWGKVIVDIKDSAYRVTFSNITFKATVSPSAFNTPTSFESVFFKRGGLLKRMKEDNLNIYNYTFEKNFIIKSNLSTSDNW